MLHMIPFEAEHFLRIEEQEAMSYLRPDRTPDMLDVFAASPFGFTGINDAGGVVISAGIVPFLGDPPMVGEAWAVIAHDAQPFMLSIVKSMKRFLSACYLPRVQAVVRRDFDPGHRLVRMLGFELETPDGMRRFHRGEITCDLYAKIKG